MKQHEDVEAFVPKDWCPICRMRKANPAKCPHGEFLRVTEPGSYAVEHLERMYRVWMLEKKRRVP